MEVIVPATAPYICLFSFNYLLFVPKRQLLDFEVHLACFSHLLNPGVAW